MGFVAGGLGDLTCGTSLTIDILRLAATNHNLTNKYIKYFIFVTFYSKKRKKKQKRLIVHKHILTIIPPITNIALNYKPIVSQRSKLLFH